MRFLVLAAAALLPGMSSAAPPQSDPARLKSLEVLGPLRGDCPPTAAQRVARQIRQQGHLPHFHRLVELPPAQAYAAMVRQIGGCEVPLILANDGELPLR